MACMHAFNNNNLVIMAACLQVCMHACMHTCIHTCIHTCMHTCMHAHIHACMHACMYVCIMLCPTIRFGWYREVGNYCRSTLSYPQLALAHCRLSAYNYSASLSLFSATCEGYKLCAFIPEQVRSTVKACNGWLGGAFFGFFSGRRAEYRGEKQFEIGQ
jgi:hypothetical protein